MPDPTGPLDASRVTTKACPPCKCVHRTREPHCRHAHDPWPTPPHAVAAPEPITDPMHGATLIQDPADGPWHAARHATILADAADGIGLDRPALTAAALLGRTAAREGRPCEAGRDEWADDDGPRDEPALARLIDAHHGPHAPIRAALIRDAYRTGWDAHRPRPTSDRLLAKHRAHADATLAALDPEWEPETRP